MVIVTLRVACYEIEEEEDYLQQRKCCARIFPCCVSDDEVDEMAALKKEQHEEAMASAPPAALETSYENEHSHNTGVPSAGATTAPTSNVTNVQVY